MSDVRASENAGDHPGARPQARPGIMRRFGGCFRRGLPRGLKSAVWLLMIMVPVSFAVMVLRWCHVLEYVAFAFEPAFRLVDLPGEAAIAFITGLFLNIYTSIAAMAAIPLTDRQVTVIALVVLISHNFPVEVPVQRRAGTAAWKMIVLRLGMSAVAAVSLNMMLPADPGEAVTRGVVGAEAGGLLDHLLGWLMGTAWLVGKVAGLIMALMILHQILLEFGVAKILARISYPLLWLLGLPRSTTVLWMVANTLGLAYGAAVIVEEADSGRLSKEDAQYLNRHIAICHSLLEDTLLYVAVGAWALWITVPRVALAAVAVWAYRALRAMGLGRIDAGGPEAGTTEHGSE